MIKKEEKKTEWEQNGVKIRKWGKKVVVTASKTNNCTVNYYNYQEPNKTEWHDQVLVDITWLNGN